MLRISFTTEGAIHILGETFEYFVVVTRTDDNVETGRVSLKIKLVALMFLKIISFSTIHQDTVDCI